MMRGNDEQDMDDVAFLVRAGNVSVGEVEDALARVRIPDLIELRDAFERALPTVREIANRCGRQ